MKKPLIPIFLAALTLHATEPHLRSQDARALAATLRESVLDGSSVTRLKLETAAQAGGEKVVLQLLAKARRNPAGSDVLYQVLWPKTRQGEGFLLQKPDNRPATGVHFTPPNTVAPVKLQDGIFGSALAYEDLVDDFFGWKSQELVGEETIGRVACRILESKPGPGQPSGYASVRSWIDIRRTVPVRIEKYGAGGALVRRITITRLNKDDINRLIPSHFTVQRAGMAGETALEGTSIKHDVTLTDADFTEAALRSGAAP
jgi:hypothetical protein